MLTNRKGTTGNEQEGSFPRMPGIEAAGTVDAALGGSELAPGYGLGWLAYSASSAVPTVAERMRSGGNLYRLSRLSCCASPSTKSC